MAQEFKAGDLALIIGSFSDENIGKTVRLVEFIEPYGGPFMCEGVLFPEREVPTWIVESIDGSASLVGGYTWRSMMVKAGPCREKWLMPLKGNRQSQNQKSKESEPCA